MVVIPQIVMEMEIRFFLIGLITYSIMSLVSCNQNEDKYIKAVSNVLDESQIFSKEFDIVNKGNHLTISLRDTTPVFLNNIATCHAFYMLKGLKEINPEIDSLTFNYLSVPTKEKYQSIISEKLISQVYGKFKNPDYEWAINYFVSNVNSIGAYSLSNAVPVLEERYKEFHFKKDAIDLFLSYILECNKGEKNQYFTRVFTIGQMYQAVGYEQIIYINDFLQKCNCMKVTKKFDITHVPPLVQNAKYFPPAGPAAGTSPAKD